MTDPTTETFPRETFSGQDQDQGQDVTPAEGAAGAGRRRRVVAAGVLAVVAVAVPAFFLLPGPEEDAAEAAVTVVEPKFTGDLTVQECPGNREGASGGFVGEETELPSAREQAETLGKRSVRPTRPDAQLVRTEESSDRSAYAYVLPNGYRVAVLDFVRTASGWYLDGWVRCVDN